jgi:hypothetical protein
MILLMMLYRLFTASKKRKEINKNKRNATFHMKKKRMDKKRETGKRK